MVHYRVHCALHDVGGPELAQGSLVAHLAADSRLPYGPDDAPSARDQREAAALQWQAFLRVHGMCPLVLVSELTDPATVVAQVAEHAAHVARCG